MDIAICWECIDDKFLREIIKRDGISRECSACKNQGSAITVDELGKLIEPVLRRHFQLGEEFMHSDEDDKTSFEQEGDPLPEIVQNVLGQSFDFDDEIVRAVMDAEGFFPQDGGTPFFDENSNYVATPVPLDSYYAEWANVLQELKHRRRFFNSSAQSLFEKLFVGVEKMQTFGAGGTKKSVVHEFETGSEIFRGRTLHSFALVKEALLEPLKHVGPPPSAQARAGRMNVDGVVAFYGALDMDTCLAEMRPALRSETVVIKLKTSRALRLLDFTRLEKSRRVDTLSYFQPDFVEEAQKISFLRRLHNLISQPITPGHESDYLITQTMAEYLAHVHKEPFDGILFASAQRANGVNVVLFPRSQPEETSPSNSFPLTYVPESGKLFLTRSIKYEHAEMYVRYDGKEIHFSPEDEFDGG